MRSASRGPLRPGLVLLLACLPACGEQPSTIVSVAPVPAGGGTLEVAFSLDAEGVRAVPPFSLAGHTESRMTFALRLPARREGRFGIGVAVRDKGGCIAGLGYAEIPLAAAPTELDISLQPASTGGSDCVPGAPALVSASPSRSSTAGAERVTLLGWGLQPDSVVRFDGVPATDVTWRSLLEIDATVPARPGARGPVPVSVTSGDGAQATRRDLFSYYAQGLTLADAVGYPVGKDPSSLQVGDFDGDGRLDLAVANRGSSTVSVLRNGGQGTFPAALSAQYNVGARPASLAAGDFNGDRRLDLATANTAENTVSVLLGSSMGTFGTASRQTVGFAPALVLATSLSASGAADAVVGYPLDGRLSILSGGSTPAQTFTKLDTLAGLGAADLDGDRLPELLALLNGSIAVITRPLKAPLTYSLQTYPEPAGLALGDVSGDGKPDLLTVHRGGHPAALFLGQGGGAFQRAPDGPSSSMPSAVALGDLDGDGRADAVIADAGSDSVIVLRSTGSQLVPAGNHLVGKAPMAIAVGDLDQDGRPDVVVVIPGDGTTPGSVSVLLNRSE